MFNYFKNIFYGKHNIYTQICLFSIIGILTTLFSNVITLYSPTNYFGFCSLEVKPFSAVIAVCVVLFLYLTGYVYTYINSLFNTNKTTLPEIDLNPFSNFFKMLPVQVIWGVYFSALIFLGFSMFKILTPVSYLYYVLIGCLVPFSLLIFTLYAKEFRCENSTYNPFRILAIIPKTLKPMLLLVIKTGLIFIITAFVIKQCFIGTNSLANFPPLQLSLRLLLLALWVYIFNLLALICAQGLVDISNKL